MAFYDHPLSTNALVDPKLVISATGLLTPNYLDTFIKIFKNFMNQGMRDVSINYKGEEKLINMPGEIYIINNCVDSKYSTFVFPLSYYFYETESLFHFGKDMIQFVNGKNICVLSYYKDGFVYFSIILIDNEHIYVIDINNKDSEVDFNELDGETKNNMKELLSFEVGVYDEDSCKMMSDTFKNAKVINSFKETYKSVSFENFVRELLDDCISSPEKITSKFKSCSLLEETKIYNYTWPDFNVPHHRNEMRDIATETARFSYSFSFNYHELRYKLEDKGEFFVGIFKSTYSEPLDFMCWYAKIEKEKDKNGSYLVSYNYYDAATYGALMRMCANNVVPRVILEFEYAVKSGFFPCYMRFEWFETLEEAQAEVETYYNNPQKIKSTAGHEVALTRSIKALSTK